VQRECGGRGSRKPVQTLPEHLFSLLPDLCYEYRMRTSHDAGPRQGSTLTLAGRRVLLRSLRDDDYGAWSEVRRRCRDWLLPWEPRPAHGQPMGEDPVSFAARCTARDRESQLGTGYGFGIFLPAESGRFAGEINLTSVRRAPFQSAYVGYWIDQQLAGNGYIPEAVVVLLGFAFEQLGLHRVQISIIPRNRASRRVMEKLVIREEGTAVRYLEIDGRWEDHIRYAITVEEWVERRREYLEGWIGEQQ